MSCEPPADRLQLMRALRQRREQRAEAELRGAVARHADATATAERMASAQAVHRGMRLAREAAIYRGMLGQSMTVQDMISVHAELQRHERDAAALAEQVAARLKAAQTAQRQVEIRRRRFGECHRARRKWDELAQLADRRRAAREVLTEELSLSDTSPPRPRS